MFEYANLLLEVKDIIARKTIYIPINTEIEDKNLIEIAKIYGIKDGFAEIVYNDNYKKRVFGGQIHISEFEDEVIDKTNENLPDSIMLRSINRKQIERHDYEKFEEFEIESFYKKRTIEFKTNYVELPKNLSQQAGKSDYWFIPIFSYN